MSGKAPAVDTVYVEHWQHECCGAGFAVGDEVSWPLRYDHDPDRLGRWLGPAVVAGPGRARRAA